MNARSKEQALLLTLFLAAFLLVLLRTAWVSDDAYITFRVADNLLSGFGLRWNVAERVQAFTNPLWLFLISALYAVTGDVYYTSLALSIALSLTVALLVALWIAVSTENALLALTMLALSKAFVDYSTSGLENPLTHLLLVLFGLEVLRSEGRPPRFLRIGLLAAAAALNRMDALLLLLPSLVAVALWARSARAMDRLLAGLAPLPLWMLFSVFYYGFPFPNTAYAKLSTGIPERELIEQGVSYMMNSLSADPLTLLAIVLGVLAPFLLGVGEGWPLSAGIVLYVGYTIAVGGDFMSGRFLAAPFLVAVLLLARTRAAANGSALALAVVALVGLSAPHPNILADARYFADRSERREEMMDERGISDERAVYYRGTGLLTFRRGRPMPHHYMADAGRRAHSEGETFALRGATGMFGFFAGPGVHVIDPVGLGDPFLSRLPAEKGWRVGHFARTLPHGYQAAVRKDRALMDDLDLSAYYKKLRLVTRGDLLDRERLRAIWDLNVGGAARLLDAYVRLHSTMQRVRLADVEEPLAEGSDTAAGHAFSDYGIEVALGRPRRAAQIELSLDSNDSYAVQFLQGNSVLSEETVLPKALPSGGLAVHRIEVPVRASAGGYDRIRIYPVEGDDIYSMGHLRLFEREPD